LNPGGAGAVLDDDLCESAGGAGEICEIAASALRRNKCNDYAE